jgi:hypothetical protein
VADYHVIETPQALDQYKQASWSGSKSRDREQPSVTPMEEIGGPSRASRTRPMTDSKLTQRELEARLWDAANSLRGPVDAADFKAFVPWCGRWTATTRTAR